MSRIVKFCVVCDASRSHVVVDGPRLACERCGLRSWPAGDDPVAAMFRAMAGAVATVTEAEQRENEAAWRLVERTCGWCMRPTCMAFNVGTPRFGTPTEKAEQAEAWRRDCNAVCEENRRRRAEARTAAGETTAPAPVVGEDFAARGKS